MPADSAAKNGHANLAAYLSIASASGQTATTLSNNLYDQVVFDPTEAFDPAKALLVLRAFAACSGGKPLKLTGLLATLAKKAIAGSEQSGLSIVIGSQPKEPFAANANHRSAPVDTDLPPSSMASCSCLCFCTASPASVVVEIKRNVGLPSNRSSSDLGAILNDPSRHTATQPMLKHNQPVLSSSRDPRHGHDCKSCSYLHRSSSSSSLSRSVDNPQDTEAVLKPGVWIFRMMGATSVLFWAAYLVWRSMRTLNPGWMFFYSIPVLLVEVMAWLNGLMFVLNCWNMVSRCGISKIAHFRLQQALTACTSEPVLMGYVPVCCEGYLEVHNCS